MATVGNTTITPKTWNGKYPLSDLPKGALWKGTYGGGFSCIGFARMVLDATYGAGDEFDAMYKWQDASEAKEVFENIDVGDRVTFYRRSYGSDGPYHAIIVAKISSSGVTAYDCNRVGTDKIGYELMTWQYIFDTYKYVNGGVHHK